MGTGTQAVAQGAPRPAADAQAAATPGKWSLTNLVRIGSIGLQLGIALLIIRKFGIENKGFMYLFALSGAGFAVHWALPQRFRMPFLAALSIGGIGLVIGWANAAWVVGLGCGLIGIAHLPLPVLPRVGIMLAVVVLLALFRSAVIPAPWSSVIWPILGSMFMFRMIVYMYDLRNKSAPFSPARALAYFFMLPNVSFTLFPVVDYQTFARSYYNTDEAKIYQKGVSWIMRGIAQMLLYRLIYQNVAMDPTNIVDTADVFQHVIATFGLYMKVMGSFCIAMGMMCLFGFNVPLPNNNMLLSSGYTDMWRRGNIYWKDFMQKMFFNPANMMLNRKISANAATGLATAYAFVVTWVLHSYQWYWIRDKFPILWQDMVMWGWLGVAVYLNMYLETKRPKKRSLKKPVRTLKGDVLRGLKIIGVMGSVTLTWTLIWVSPSWDDTRALLIALANVSPLALAKVAGGFLLYGVIAVAWTYTASENTDANTLAKAKLNAKELWTDAGVVVAAGGLFLLVGYYPGAFAPVSLEVADIADRLGGHKLSAQDDALLKQGYYEDLSDATRFSPELAALYSAKPANWDVNPLVYQIQGYPDFALEASKSVTFKGAKFTTNRFEMRDQEYDEKKPEGAYRFVFLGQSVEQGSGVGDGEAYEAQIEARLNAEKVSTSSTGVKRWEILNLANGGYGPIHKLAHLEKNGFRFGPDAILYVSITDQEWTENEITTAHKHPMGLAMIPFPEVQEILAKAGATQDLPRVTLVQRVRPVLGDIVDVVYKRMVAECKKRGVRPIYVLMAQPEDKPELEAKMRAELEMAKAAGFEIVDASDVYAGVPDKSVYWLARYDHHPNLEAHRMMAAKVYERLVALMGL